MEKAAIHIYPILNEDKTKTYFMKLEIENAECKMSIFDNKNDILRNDSFEGNKWILHPITSPSGFLLARESYTDAKITELDSVLLFTCKSTNGMIFKPIKIEKRIKTPSPSETPKESETCELNDCHGCRGCCKCSVGFPQCKICCMGYNIVCKKVGKNTFLVKKDVINLEASGPQKLSSVNSKGTYNISPLSITFDKNTTEGVLTVTLNMKSFTF